MRINQYIAKNSSFSRRKVDDLIINGLVLINDEPAKLGSTIIPGKDIVKLNNRVIEEDNTTITIAFNKPRGYVVSRLGQDNKTIYDILPNQYKRLNPVGRLDKNSSGLLILSSDGNLIQELSHPKNNKVKTYIVQIDKNLIPADLKKINLVGVSLYDGISKLNLTIIDDKNPKTWRVKMTEGRNRQIRRTFEALGYKVIDLHRTRFGEISLDNLKSGEVRVLSSVNRDK